MGLPAGWIAGIVLQDQQQLLGGGIPHVFATECDGCPPTTVTTTGIPIVTVTVPPLDTGFPHLTTISPSSVVELANNNVVSGLHLDSLVFGIVGYHVTNVVIANNIIDLHTSGFVGIDLEDFSGNAIIVNNQLQGHGMAADGIKIFTGDGLSSSSNVLIQNNTVSGWVGLGGIRLETFNNATMVASVDGNNSSFNAPQFSPDNADGMWIWTHDTSTFTGTITNNSVLATMRFQEQRILGDDNATLTASIIGNQFSNEWRRGIGMEWNFPVNCKFTIDVQNNTITGNAAPGHSLTAAGDTAQFNATFSHNNISSNGPKEFYLNPPCPTIVFIKHNQFESNGSLGVHFSNLAATPHA